MEVAFDPRYLIYPIAPRREVHLVCGPSGSGKTTLLLQMLECFEKGLTFLGHKFPQLKCCYISCGRSSESVAFTLERMHLQISSPIYSLMDKYQKVRNAAVMLSEHLQEAELFVIEEIGTLVESTNDYGNVWQVINFMVSTCKEKDVSVIGSTHTPKMKEGESYADPRQRAHGSVGWGGFCDTLFDLEYSDIVDDQNDGRSLHIAPRNQRGETFQLRFNSEGRLEQTDNVIVESKLGMIIRQMSDEEVFRISELDNIFDGTKAGERRVFRELREKTEKGELKKIARGTYRKMYKM